MGPSKFLQTLNFRAGVVSVLVSLLVPKQHPQTVLVSFPVTPRDT